jgi:hypothetical protein
MSLTSIQRPISECNKPVIRLVATPSCESSNGNIADGSEGVSNFPFQIITNLKGFIRDIPREIIRQNSKNCRPQKVQSSVKYELQGGNLYPAWKMREIEQSFMSEKIEIDGQEVLFSGGAIFEVAGNTCNNLYRLKTIIEECQTISIFGCNPTCLTPIYYFVIPPIPEFEVPNFFNDSGILVASGYSQLLAYYSNRANVLEVEDIVEPLPIQCSYYKVFSIKTSGITPSYLYVDSVSNSSKIFGIPLDESNPDYNKLCKGIDNTACLIPIIEPPFVYELTCGDITIGSITQFSDMMCAIMVQNMWTGDVEITSTGDTRSIDIDISSTEYISGGGAIGEIAHTIILGQECGITLSIDGGASIIDIQVNGIDLDESDYSYTYPNLTFSPCLTVGDDLIIKYQEQITPPYIKQTIALITGTMCRPLTTVYQNNENNSSIPVGATIAIFPNGEVRWYGVPSAHTDANSTITVTDIIYNAIY